VVEVVVMEEEENEEEEEDGRVCGEYCRGRSWHERTVGFGDATLRAPSRHAFPPLKIK